MFLIYMNNRFTLLPLELVNKINSIGLTKIQTAKALKFVSILLRNAEESDVGIFNFVELPISYIVKTFGTNYTIFLNPLKSYGIVEVFGFENNGIKTEFYWTSNSTATSSDNNLKNQCKSYRISKILLSSTFTGITYKDDLPYNPLHIKIGNRRIKRSVFSDLFSSLILNKQELFSEIDSYISHLTLDNLKEYKIKINEEITNRKFELKNNIYYGEVSLDKALGIARKSGLTLIQDGKRFYIGNIQQFISEKKANILWSYRRAIESLTDGLYYFSRNKTNNRFDHNYTGISKIILDRIMKDNDLVEIDQVNSQFAVLAHLMKSDPSFIHTNDFIEFKKQAASGNLYECIVEQLNLPSRDNAKSVMMELTFSHPKNNTPEKIRLKKVFPSVVKYIDTMKQMAIDKNKTLPLSKREEKPHAILANTLTKQEANFFVDNIYLRLIKQKYFCITKHDSLIIRNKDYEEIRQIVDDYFASINYECKLLKKNPQKPVDAGERIDLTPQVNNYFNDQENSQMIEHTLSDGHKIYTLDYFKRTYEMEDSVARNVYQNQFNLTTFYATSKSDYDKMNKRINELKLYKQFKKRSY